jgi:hypothetical protein
MRVSGRISALAGVLLAMVSGAAHAQAAPVPAQGAIYRCIGPDKKLVTKDRPMTDCVGEQYFVNPDGSNNRLVPRPLTEEEREEADRKEREDEAARRARQIEERADRELLKRYPDKAAHDLARKAALDSARADIKNSDARIADLLRLRKPLLDEAEFYVNKPYPLKLRLAFDANDAALAAQKSLRQNQEDEVQRIDKLYDAELARLTKLWAARPSLPKRPP